MFRSGRGRGWAWLATAGLCLGAMGCAGEGAARPVADAPVGEGGAGDNPPAEPVRARPLARIVGAAETGPTVVPVVIAGGWGEPGGTVRVRTEHGEEVDARLVRLGGAGETVAPPSGFEAWFGVVTPRRPWWGVELGAGAFDWGSERGSGDSRSVWMGPERVRVMRAHEGNESRGGGAESVARMGALGEWLRAAGPSQAWRVAATDWDGVGLDAAADAAARPWRAALARLGSASPELLARVRGRLTTMLDIGPGVTAPGWDPRGEESDALLASLLAAGTDTGELAGRAETWLESCPSCLVWVVDDGGIPVVGGVGGITTLAVANLTGERMAARAGSGPAGAHEGGEPRSIGPSSVAFLTATGPAVGGAEGERVFVRVRAGRKTYEREILPTAIRARPPGVALGPLLADWSLASLHAQGKGESSAAQDPPLLAPATTALLHADPDASAPAASDGTPGAWLIYVECAGVDGGGSSDGPDVVRVWLGPYQAARNVLRVTSDGLVRDERELIREARGEATSTGGAETDRRVRVSRTARGWSAWIPVPAGAIDADGVLRVGLERSVAGVGRGSWPRPMLPWQREPGRALIDTRAWRGTR
ncbi:MAG: hypothetical protein JNM07_04155 [Phycisphaerae bacterium]|nr:hypothetical protein [Phycisphaerae bacterium]